MFRRRKETETGTVKSDLEGIPWDEKTVAWFADQPKFTVQITSVTKTRKFGQWLSADVPDPLLYEVWGVMHWPKFIAVEIVFGPDTQNSVPFGGFRYSTADARPRDEKMKVPFLIICLSN